jgi:coenzyme Q-binding protein COQ10
VISRHEQHHLPWQAERMFDLVADIERYHEFLPAWSHARITRREGNILTVVQGIDLGILRLDFESRAELERPSHLRVSSSTRPFRRFQLDWRITPAARGGCVVALAVHLEMHSALLEATSGRLLDRLTRDIFRRFRERAAALYGD